MINSKEFAILSTSVEEEMNVLNTQKHNYIWKAITRESVDNAKRIQQ